jgi:ABC-type multidrug transport system permease subunit
VLKRLAVTPVSATLLVVTQMPTYTLLGVGTAVGMLAVGRLAGAHVELIPHLIWVVPLVALVIFTELGLAFVISGLLPHPGAAGQLSSGRGVPLLFLSGAMLPVDALPGALPEITKVAVPFTSTIEAIRGVVLEGASITSYGPEVLVGVAWALAALGLATTAYRFDQE